MLRTAGIPVWVTVFALIVLAVGCALGLMALLGQGSDPNMTVSWGGRHLGLGLAAGMAVLLKNPSAYITAFVGGVGRDLGDLIAHLSRPQPSIGVLVGIVVFLIAGVLGILAANRARLGRAVAHT
jgi:hypothetical protein